MDWGRYTWTYPWIGFGRAAAAGLLVYTGSHPRVAAEPARPADPAASIEPVAGAAPEGQKPSRTGWNLLLGAWDFLYPVAAPCGPELHVQLA